jgi:trimethylamine--corrinoid protein Co-methyltransferase
MNQIKRENVCPYLRVLSDDQIYKIHNATVEVMTEIGIVIKDEEGIRLLEEAGADVQGELVKIPEHLLKRALTTAPSRISVYNRHGNLAMNLERGKTYFGTGSDTIYTMDVYSKERRKTAAIDVRNIARLTDAMPNLDFVMSMGNPGDVKPEDSFIIEFIEMLRGTTKPIVFTAITKNDMETIYRVASGVAGSEEYLREKPFIIQYAEPVSPRLFNPETVQRLLFCAEKGIPVAFPPSPNTGAGGPITVAGAMVLGNAECLTGLILTQLKNPGAPFIFGTNIAALDMKTAVVSYGAPEWILGSAGTVEMARFYNLPAWGTSGASDSKVVDAQAGMEAMLSVYNALLTRSQLIHDNGYIESGLTSSMEMIILADEAISISRYIMNGITVDTDSLALDPIRRVKPGKGFLDDDHTLNYWRKVQYLTERMNRKIFEYWKADGELDMYTRLNEEAKKILETHKVAELSDNVERIIEEIFKEKSEG